MRQQCSYCSPALSHRYTDIFICLNISREDLWLADCTHENNDTFLVTTAFKIDMRCRSEPLSGWIHIHINWVVFRKRCMLVKYYSDVIMSAIASQITYVSNVCSTLCFRHRSKKTSKLRVIGLCEGNPLVTGGFPSHTVSNAENASIWWRCHVFRWGPNAIRHPLIYRTLNNSGII